MSEHEAVISLIPIFMHQIQVRHIKSHQDKGKVKGNIKLPEQLNSISDKLADMYATVPKIQHPIQSGSNIL